MTRLKSISIRNFKAYKGLQEIPLKPITLIFGPNSAGKSTIAHALAFLKHAYQKNGDCSPDEVDLVWDKVTLGGWQNLLHGHDPKQNMQLGIEFGEDISSKWTFEGSDQGPLASKCVIAQGGTILASAVNQKPRGLKWEITLDEQHPKLSSLADRIWNFLWKGDEIRPVPHTHKDSSKLPWEQFHTQFLAYLRTHPMTTAGLFPGALNEKKRKLLEADDLNHRGPGFESVLITTHPSGEETQSDGETLRKWLLDALVSEKDTNLQLKEFFSHCIDVASFNEEFSHAPGVREFEQLFQSHVHLGPSREAPPRDIDKQSLENNAQYGPWLELLENKERRDQVNDSLKGLDLNYELVTRWKETITYFPSSGEVPEHDASQEVEFRDRQEQLAFKIRNSQVTLSHRDLGYGVSMVLPILVALHSPAFKLLTMEQPELHLHPKQQADLGDEIIMAALRRELGNESARTPNCSKQLLIECHSENLILRIQRRIRETARGTMTDWPERLRKACPNGIRPEDVVVLCVEPGEDGAKVIELPMTIDGGFTKSWPRGFFAERLMEMYSINEDEL